MIGVSQGVCGQVNCGGNGPSWRYWMPKVVVGVKIDDPGINEGGEIRGSGEDHGLRG